jgi:hypothetical protein
LPVERFLWAWAGVTIVLFTIAATKLPHYVLPAFPPIAILLARAATLVEPKRLWAAVWCTVVLAAAIGVGFVTAPSGFADVVAVARLALVASAACGFLALALRLPSQSAFAAAASSFCVLVLLLGLPAYWRASHADAFEIAKSVKSLGRPVIDFRTDGMGASGATSHPSLRYYFGPPDQSMVWGDDLLAMADLRAVIVSRRDRLSAALRADMLRLGPVLKQGQSIGEWQVFHVETGH